jgi:hypothetical protein
MYFSLAANTKVVTRRVALPYDFIVSSTLVLFASQFSSFYSWAAALYPTNCDASINYGLVLNIARYEYV